MFSEGMVYAPNRDWAQMVIDEMAMFSAGKYDDLTDSGLSLANNLWHPVAGWSTSEEWRRAQAEQAASERALI
jgi:hypothetical protein